MGVLLHPQYEGFIPTYMDKSFVPSTKIKVCIVLKFGMNFPRLLAIKISPGFGLDLTPVQGVMTIAHWVIINDLV